MPLTYNKFQKRSVASTMLWQPEIRTPDSDAGLVMDAIDWNSFPSVGADFTLDGEIIDLSGNMVAPWAFALVFARNADTPVATIRVTGRNQFGEEVSEIVELVASASQHTETLWCYSIVTAVTLVAKGTGTTATVAIQAQTSLSGASPARSSYIACPARLRNSDDILSLMITDDTGIAAATQSAVVDYVGEPYYKIGLTPSLLDTAFSFVKLLINPKAVGL